MLGVKGVIFGPSGDYDYDGDGAERSRRHPGHEAETSTWLCTTAAKVGRFKTASTATGGAG